MRLSVPWVLTHRARGFSCVVSGSGQVLKSARVFGQRPRTSRPVGDKAPRHT